MDGKEFTHRIRKEILPVLDQKIRKIIAKLSEKRLACLTEIRLRSNKPLLVQLLKEELILNQKGNLSDDIRQAYYVSQVEVENSLGLMSKGSFYTLEDEFRAGYLTIAGGHRVGMVGEVVKKAGQIERLKNISGLNIRICREVIGAADGIINKIIKGRRDIYNTLIISAPGCGKTTLLRDLTRQISNGVEKFDFPGLKVGVVDERSEIGGAYCGIAQNKLGIRTDLIDRCPKSQGMMLLIRAMSPQVLITDEIGSKADITALKEALKAGVRVITTMHASSLEEAKSRPGFKKILQEKFFSRIIILSNRSGPGTIERVIKRG